MITRTTLDSFLITKSSKTPCKPTPSESRVKQIGASFFSSFKDLKNDVKKKSLLSKDEIDEFSNDEPSLHLSHQNKFGNFDAKKEIEEVEISEFSSDEISVHHSPQKESDSIDLESESDGFCSPSLVSENDEHGHQKISLHQSAQELFHHSELESQMNRFTLPPLKMNSDEVNEFSDADISDECIYIPIFDSSDLLAGEKNTRKRKTENEPSKDDVVKKRKLDSSFCEISIDSEDDSLILASP